MGVELAVSESDWLRAGLRMVSESDWLRASLRMDLQVFVYSNTKTGCQLYVALLF